MNTAEMRDKLAADGAEPAPPHTPAEFRATVMRQIIQREKFINSPGVSGGLMRAVGRLPLAMLTLLGAVLLANAMRLRLAVRGFRRLKKDGQSLRYGRWVAVGLLLYVALLTGPLGAARFLVPVWPLLLGLALAGLRWRYVPGGLGPEQASPVGENQRQG